MRFGWLTLAHSPGPDQDAVAIEQQLEQACYADALGFDGIWLTEHNFTGEAVYSDPIPFAAAVAVRTSRARIGFAVIQVALRHPTRLAIQLSLLDNLSHGRLDVGVGRGTLYNEYEFVGYGLRSDDSRERTEEALEVLVGAWTRAPFTYRGKYFQLAIPELRPRPYQRPHPPIWRSVVAPASFRECGRLGVPILTQRLGLARILDRLKLYDEGLEQGGHDAATRERLRRSAALWRHVYVADSDAEAEDDLAHILVHTRQHMMHARAVHNPADFHIDPALLNPFNDSRVSDEDAVRHSLENGALYGTPARVAEQVAAIRDAGVHHVLTQMSFGYVPHEKLMASMRRFAGHVMPRFRGD
jgi:alkanesulfonate monooxygenase SsuD/methylene tetrahydromethanopterin reductase-like flavin-dependent oxidoreductase (luciferase family)